MKYLIFFTACLIASVSAFASDSSVGEFEIVTRAPFQGSSGVSGEVIARKSIIDGAWHLMLRPDGDVSKVGQDELFEIVFKSFERFRTFETDRHVIVEFQLVRFLDVRRFLYEQFDSAMRVGEEWVGIAGRQRIDKELNAMFTMNATFRQWKAKLALADIQTAAYSGDLRVSKDSNEIVGLSSIIGVEFKKASSREKGADETSPIPGGSTNKMNPRANQ